MARPALRQTLLAAAFYAVATVLFTWPVAAHVGNGLADVWDAKLNAWILNWDYHQTFHDPVHLFDANVFYPARYALAFSENLYGAAIFGFPLYAAGVSAVTAYNILFLLGMFLSGLGAWALARDVTRDPVCSLLAGVVYAFVPWRLAQIPHVQFQWGPFLPLLLVFLLRYLHLEKRRDAALFGLFFIWNALTNVHYALFSGLLVSVVLAHRAIVGGPGTLRRVRMAIGTAAAACLVLVPFFLPYVRASNLYGMERGDEEIRVYSGRPVDLLTAGPQNKLYAPWTQKWAQPEGDFFPGLAVAGLAAAAVIPRRRSPLTAVSPSPGGLPARRRRAARILDVVATVLVLVWIAAKIKPGLVAGPLRLGDPGRVLVFLTAVLFARTTTAFPRGSRYRDLTDFLRRTRIGPENALFLAIAATGLIVAFGMHTPYYRFLVQSFGAVFRSIRVPSRGIVLFDLALGVLASRGLSGCTSRLSPSRKRIAVALALGAVTFEYRAFPVDVSPVDPVSTPVDRWLAGISRVPVVEWPLGTVTEVEHQFRSTAHWLPLLNGYSGFAPPHYLELSAIVNRKPMPSEVWDRISRLGARILVFHPHELVGDERLGYVRGTSAGVRSGRVQPLALFPHGSEVDGVFAIGSPVRADPVAAEQARVWLERLALQGSPPFGALDWPREGSLVRSGAWASGWALDDSGIAEVLVSADGGALQPAMIGLRHPGVIQAYPTYPEVGRAGFGFGIPVLTSGDHVLTVVFRARDGGVSKLERRIRLQ